MNRKHFTSTLKIAAVMLLCVMLTVFAAGCSSALTPEEYRDRFKDEFHAYTSATQEISDSLANKTCNTAAVDKAKAALDNLAALEPPNEYKDLHKDLCAGIKDEREWLDLTSEFFELINSGSTDTDKAKSLVNSLNSKMGGSKFAEAALAVARQFKKDLS